MNKKIFLKTLNTSLRRIPEEERQDILNDYEEHFESGLAEGKREEDLASSLGAPKQIARELIALYHVDQVKTTMNTRNVLRAVWAVIGLSFLNLVIVLGPLAAVIGIIAGFFGLSLGFTLSPIVVFIDLVQNPVGFHSFNLFFSLALCGIGLLLGLAMLEISKVLIKGLIKYLNFNVSLVKGGLK